MALVEFDPMKPLGHESPPRVRNVYGQMVDDIKRLGKSYKKVRKQRRAYDQLKMYGDSQRVQDATKVAISADQQMALQKRLSKRVGIAVDSANDGLAVALAHERKSEKRGQQLFSYHQKMPKGVKDAKYRRGPFQRLFADSVYLHNELKRAKAIEKGINTKDDKLVMHRLYPGKGGKKELKGIRKLDDVPWLYDRSRTDYNTKNSPMYRKVYKREHEKAHTLELLKAAAAVYRRKKLEKGPNYTYQMMVHNTNLEGKENPYVLDMSVEAHRLKKQSNSMAQKELKLSKDHEKYLHKHDWLARKEGWPQPLDRQVNKAVIDPDNKLSGPKGETAIQQEMANIQEQRKANPERDLKYLQSVREKEQAMFDEGVASVVRQAPGKADMRQLVKDGVLGAKQLVKDTKVANRRLKKSLDRGPKAHRKFKVRNPNWKKLQKMAKLQQSQKLVRVAQVSVAKDARRLAKSGSRVDLKVLNHDTQAAQKGQLTLSGPEKLILKKEQHFFDHMRRTRGEETLHDMKAGIRARAKREMKHWNKVKHVVENAGLPISYGASALHSLPERDDDPLMSNIMKQRFNGNTGLVTTPIRRDDPPGPLSSKLDPVAKETARNGSETRVKQPRPGYSRKDHNSLSSLIVPKLPKLPREVQSNAGYVPKEAKPKQNPYDSISLKRNEPERILTSNHMPKHTTAAAVRKKQKP